MPQKHVISEKVDIKPMKPHKYGQSRVDARHSLAQDLGCLQRLSRVS